MFIFEFRLSIQVAQVNNHVIPTLCYGSASFSQTNNCCTYNNNSNFFPVLLTF